MNHRQLVMGHGVPDPSLVLSVVHEPSFCRFRWLVLGCRPGAPCGWEDAPSITPFASEDDAHRFVRLASRGAA